jgi:hypothetical protein
MLSLASTPRTLARRRLRLGITGVGASVLLSLGLVGLTLGGVLPLAPDWRLFPGAFGTMASAAVLTLAVFAGHAALMLAVEHAGGRRAVRQAPAFGAWCVAWLRGTTVLSVVAAGCLTMIITAGARGGSVAAAVTAFVLAIALLVAQGPIARATASLTLRPAADAVAAVARDIGLDPEGLRVVHTADESFVGGWIGWDRHALWIPAWWTQPEHRALLRVQLHRRLAQRTSYARRRGWWRAALWPALGLLLTAPLLPYAWTDTRLWLVLPALSTLWSFVAVLLLPSVSRSAVYYADSVAARAEGVDTTIAVIARLDAAQDDEPERTPVVETIFHPVPSVSNRARRLRERTAPPMGGGHQQTRLTLFASLATGSLLGRMVHCNIGRPALWVVYPGD